MKNLITILLLLFICVTVIAQTGEVKPNGAKLLQTPNNATFSFNIPDTSVWINMGVYGTANLARANKKYSIWNHTGISNTGWGTGKLLGFNVDGNLVPVSSTGGSMIYPGAGIPVSNGSMWSTSLPDNHLQWDDAYTYMGKVRVGVGGSMGILNTTQFYIANNVVGLNLSEEVEYSGLPIASYAVANALSGYRPTSWNPSWSNITSKPLTFAPDAHTLDSHSNVSDATKTTNDILKWDGTNWVNVPIPSGGGATNLSFTPSATTGTVNSDTGTDATINVVGTVAGTNLAGLMIPADKTKLDGIESGATAYNPWGFSVNGGSVQTVPGSNVVNFIEGSGITITPSGLSLTFNSTGGSMVYPGSGIPISNGSAWGTSITNNSANWNTAYGWGNHSGLYTVVADRYKVALNSSPTSGDYLNGAWFTAGANGYVPVVDTYVTNGEVAPVASNAVYDELVLKANLSGATFTGAIYGTTASFSEVYRGYSDIRLKKNIEPIKCDISKIKFYQFQMKGDSTNKKRYGVIAQEVKKYMPELVGVDQNGMLTIDYTDLLVAKTSELESRINLLGELVFVLFGLVVFLLGLIIYFRK